MDERGQQIPVEELSRRLPSAVMDGNISLVESLLAANADPNVRDFNGESALDYAVKRKD